MNDLIQRAGLGASQTEVLALRLRIQLEHNNSVDHTSSFVGALT